MLPGDAILPYVMRRPYSIHQKGMEKSSFRNEGGPSTNTTEEPTPPDEAGGKGLRGCGPCSGRKVVPAVKETYIKTAMYPYLYRLFPTEEVALPKGLLRHSTETNIDTGKKESGIYLHW